MGNLGRREFLKQGLLAVAALSALPPRVRAGGERKKIIVLGAGLAGLSAAYELIQGGHEVTVLEARLRAGGRVYTLREPFSDGLYAEAGAARIPDAHDLTIKYARLFDLELESFYPTERAFLNYVRGKRVKGLAGEPLDVSQLPLDLTPEEKKGGVPGMWQKYVLPVLTELGDPKAPDWPPPSLRKYDQVRWPDFLRQQGASADAAALMTLGNDLNGASALYILRLITLDQNARQLFRIKGGNDLLPRAMSARVAERIRYGAPVVRIEQDARGVQAVFLQAGTHQRIAGDYLICAIPFSVLRRVQVSPRFSAEKHRAIEQLPYMSVARVFLQSRRKFWAEEGLNGFARTDHPAEIWDFAFQQPSPRGLLVSYMTGALARRVTAMPLEERLRYGLEQTEQVFPGMRENFEGGTSMCWDEDEWARGAAAEFEPGQMGALIPSLARPEGRVHFAGEHTSPWPGWMQGALHSGSRVAREVREAP